MLTVLIFPSDLGKVLAGIQVPQQDSLQFDQFLKKLDYSYVEETHNSVYKRFLQG
jgi:threonine dehydratase